METPDINLDGKKDPPKKTGIYFSKRCDSEDEKNKKSLQADILETKVSLYFTAGHHQMLRFEKYATIISTEH